MGADQSQGFERVAPSPSPAPVRPRPTGIHGQSTQVGEAPERPRRVDHLRLLLRIPRRPAPCGRPCAVIEARTGALAQGEKPDPFYLHALTAPGTTLHAKTAHRRRPGPSRTRRRSRPVLPAPPGAPAFRQRKPERMGHPTQPRFTRIARDDVAAFVVAQLDSDRYLCQRPFTGHR